MKPGFVPPRGLPTRPNNTYVFTIGDLAVFEKQLAEAQNDLGWDLFAHTPVVYDDNNNLKYDLFFLFIFFVYVPLFSFPVSNKYIGLR